MNNKESQFPMIAKTMTELEDVLAQELIELGADNVEIGKRMVSFTGDNALMYKANVHCRTALRILKPIQSFKAKNAEEVYDAVKEINWGDFLSLNETFSIDAVVYSETFGHSKFVAYRVKDAIADWFMEKYNKRPSVSLTDPDIYINIHISHTKCTLSLDSSGESLHKRGYRIAQTEAPLNEVLAAGMILKTGWRGEKTFIDPMCGSGTIVIEAAMIALGIPPGIHRQHFAFEKWSDFDKELFSEVYNDDSSSREFNHKIIGSDISPKAISIAEINIRNAGLKANIDLSVKSFANYTEAPDSTGVIVTNPPYGKRIKIEESDDIYAMIGERLKHAFAGYEAYILSYKKEFFDKIGLKPSERFFLDNGSLECEMRKFEIFTGKHKEFRTEGHSFSKKRQPINENPRQEPRKRDDNRRDNRNRDDRRENYRGSDDRRNSPIRDRDKVRNDRRRDDHGTNRRRDDNRKNGEQRENRPKDGIILKKNPFRSRD